MVNFMINGVYLAVIRVFADLSLIMNVDAMITTRGKAQLLILGVLHSNKTVGTLFTLFFLMSLLLH